MTGSNTPQKSWTDDHKAFGPQEVAKPMDGDVKGIAKFDYKDNGGEDPFKWLWPHIKQSTESGELGYYSWLSEDCLAIYVHFADINDKDRIQTRLSQFNIKNIRYTAKIYGRLSLSPVKPKSFHCLNCDRHYKRDGKWLKKHAANCRPKRK